jgi:hypothetical protein
MKKRKVLAVSFLTLSFVLAGSVQVVFSDNSVYKCEQAYKRFRKGERPPSKVVKECEDLAKKGVPKAQLSLGKMYVHSKNPNANVELSIKYLEECSSQTQDKTTKKECQKQLAKSKAKFAHQEVQPKAEEIASRKESTLAQQEFQPKAEEVSPAKSVQPNLCENSFNAYIKDSAKYDGVTFNATGENVLFDCQGQSKQIGKLRKKLFPDQDRRWAWCKDNWVMQQMHVLKETESLAREGFPMALATTGKFVYQGNHYGEDKVLGTQLMLLGVTLGSDGEHRVEEYYGSINNAYEYLASKAIEQKIYDVAISYYTVSGDEARVASTKKAKMEYEDSEKAAHEELLILRELVP